MPSRRIAIAGLGTIGRAVARRLADGLPGLALSAIATRDRAKAQAWLDQEHIACPLISLGELPAHADLVLECAPAELLDQICRPMLNAGKAVMVMSASALLPRPDLIEFARVRGGRIIVPTGALLGLDAVIAAAEGIISRVQITTRKPPAGLAGAPYLVEKRISVDRLNSALRVFEGNGRDAAAAFPANVNVVAALSLAGIGPDRTSVENLGGSGGNAKLPSDRRRIRFGALFDVDREYPFGKSQNGTHHGTVGDRCTAQADRATANRYLDGHVPTPG